MDIKNKTLASYNVLNTLLVTNGKLVGPKEEKQLSVEVKDAVREAPLHKITREMREQMRRGAERWDEIEGKVKPSQPQIRTYIPKTNDNYIADEKELQYWASIFDGERTLFLAEIINRMLFDKILDLNPQNTTKMINILFRAAYNGVLQQPKGRFVHEYTLMEAK